ACHVGNYNLAYEAQARGGPNHPKLSSDATVNTCLACHKAAAERTGLAPLMLRTIVHAAHMNSDTFIGYYKGNCFTCHDISETGQFKLLGTKVTSNQYNVPEQKYINDKGYVASGQDIAQQPTAGRELLASMAKGARIYDTWWKTVTASAPTGNQPLWATQSTNTRTGGDTWRCKECHGWDYKGAAGAYGSGSHKTGFVGVMGAASTKSKDQLIGILKGSTSTSHNFSSQIGDDGIASLADFLKGALIDESQYIDYSAKKPIGANADRGKEIYGKACAGCHAADGTTFNFGTAASPEYVGTIAKDNPWEFTHKVRFGQPGTSMPAAIEMGWSLQDVMDVLAYAQTLRTN
ncbi:MAG: c-type cytochrome, partial [Dehalococcoidia bacterium]|nr:c-type cytochrome [Dehalococcoidia bacterium]